MSRRGFLYDDLIIWDRHADYSSLRPLGYPSVFRINKVHEFVLIFRRMAGGELERECAGAQRCLAASAHGGAICCP